MTGASVTPTGLGSAEAPEPSGLGPTGAIPSAAGFLIEADIPIPERQTARVAKYGGPKYPWAEMREGDSFFVPGDSSAQQQIRVNTASNVRARKNPGEHYITRVVPGGVRVWRIAAIAMARDSAETLAAPVPQDCQARPEGIAQ